MEAIDMFLVVTPIVIQQSLQIKYSAIYDQ